MGQYLLDVAGISDRGVKRDHNEDAWSAPHSNLTPGQISAKGRLYVVADGVGGHQAGDVASTMAVEIIQQHYYANPSSDVAAGLREAIQAASKKINQEASAQPARRGMSTTVTAVVLRGNKLTVANVGDSRTYLIRQGGARQLTNDHTWVEEQVRGGLITQEAARRHPHRNIITRSLGSKRGPEIDIFEEEVEPGDGVLLCSDGLSNMVSDVEVGSIVGREWTAEAAVNELIELAILRGAPDNVTALLIGIVRPVS
jgi:serine/threonine protein phosphatase PrpC